MCRSLVVAQGLLRDRPTPHAARLGTPEQFASMRPRVLLEAGLCGVALDAARPGAPELFGLLLRHCG